MTPGKVAIFAVIVLVLGVLTSFWLKEETDMESRNAEIERQKQEETKNRDDAAPKVARLVIRQPKVEPLENYQYELTYVVANEGKAWSEPSTKITIFPMRLGIPPGSMGEEPISEGQYGWDFSQQDTIPSLRPGQKMERKLTFTSPSTEMTPSSYLSQKIHFSIPGQPSE